MGHGEGDTDDVRMDAQRYSVSELQGSLEAAQMGQAHREGFGRLPMV